MAEKKPRRIVLVRDQTNGRIAPSCESHRNQTCGPNDDGSRCDCRSAVTRAYRSLLGSGTSPTIALEAATRVYCYHHPEASLDMALTAVEAWVTGGYPAPPTVGSTLH